MNREVWKEIPGYELLYQASTEGRIRSYDGKQTFTNHHGIRTWKSRILKFKGYTPKTGYRVDLWKDGKPKTFLVARLVATTFLKNLIKTTMTVNHKDGNRMNNFIDNLEWLSLGDNIRHGFETGLYKSTKIKITNLLTNEEFTLRSMSLASQFIGRSKGYISVKVSKKQYQNKKWKWEVAMGKVYIIERELIKLKPHPNGMDMIKICKERKVLREVKKCLISTKKL